MKLLSSPYSSVPIKVRDIQTTGEDELLREFLLSLINMEDVSVPWASASCHEVQKGHGSNSHTLQTLAQC
jgi:hypothetical protein